MPDKKSAVFFLESQPPHFGELISVLLKMRDYDFMNICVSGISKTMPVRNVVATWLFVLDAYRDKMTISALAFPFIELSELPKQFKDCTVLTTDREVFVHMSSLNIPAELVPRTLGYHGVFIRTAHRQGRALDWLLKQAAHNVKHVPKTIKIKEGIKNEKITDKN